MKKSTQIKSLRAIIKMIQWNKFALAYRKTHCKSTLSVNYYLYTKINTSMLLFLFFFLHILIFNAGEAHFLHFDQNTFRALATPLILPHIEHYAPPHTHLPVAHHPQQHLTKAYSAKELSAAEVMVDVSNDLTYRVLHYHSILNRNNFAFSPTALMSVMVALYEGAEGRSAKEIKSVMQFPNNRDVIRVGYRDIHRRLRTYFFESENPLKGLCMNRSNITITRDYETVLDFYGYDLNMDMISAASKIHKTETEPSTTTTTTTTTTTPEVAITSSTSTSTTTARTTITTPIDTTTIATTTEEPTITTTESTPVTTTTTTTVTPAEESTTVTTADEETTTAVATETTEGTEATTVATTNEAEELISAFVAEENSEPLLRIQKARVVRLPNARLIAPPRTSYLPQSARKLATTARMARNKRHLFGLKDLESELFLSLFNPESVQNHYHLPEVFLPHNDFVTSHIRASAQKQQQYNTDVINHVFYLNDQEIIYTTFKVYNAVLYYKYYENLRMNVLELELDTQQYNLMILLPEFHTDLVTAAAALRLGPTLRTMRKQLKPRWVQAIIPDFHLQGSIFLTNDLQNLGVCDIFEPNRADLRPMTEEPGVYVKHIEQSINVHIRTHPINQHKRNYGAQTQPIQLSVNHPFIFFIIDRDLDVAVMAGRVLNPLNVRIQ